MFGWIDGLFHRAASAVSGAVSDLIHFAVRGLYAFLHGVFGAVGNGWRDFWNNAVALWAGMRRFTSAVYQKFIWVLRHIVPYLEDYIKWVRTILTRALEAAARLLSEAIQALYHQVLIFLDQLRKWAINEIWNPLFKVLTTAMHWITHEGSIVWNYFTHLASFAQLLMPWLIAELERVAWDAGKKLGTFFFSLIIHNIVRFANLMESIVDAVL